MSTTTRKTAKENSGKPAAAKKPAAAPLRGPMATAMLAALLVVIVAGWGYWAWQRVASRVAADDRYLLDPQQIEITPQPAWVRGDVRAEVIRDGSLSEPLSMLDEALSQRIASAFEFHPWVAKAKVSLEYPAQAHVAIRYRKPVAAVALGRDTEQVLAPIDVEGVRLPDRDFLPQEKLLLPRITSIGSLPLTGQRSSDPRVLGAARLAELFGSDWQTLFLERIVPLGSAAATKQRPCTYQLVTRGKLRIDWGTAPGDESDAELPAGDKLARLRWYAKTHGGLDHPERPATLDVRDLPAPPQ